ncbi:MAG: exodeoxyribonuclease VII large subunit [Desulfobacteraceae bacterium]|nr:exodeoxyribonuclease VII large subunit [Desulfobacteraceae bacterium]
MMRQDHRRQVERKIYSVSELTAELKELLEDSYPFVWISGEISNIRMPASGHYYFTLKDSDAQIQAVMFKGQNRSLKFRPEDGMTVTGFGRISVYPPRGSYQVILEYLEPSGAGALQAAFEQLKKKLADEGFFDEVHKKKIPFLPSRIAVISSSTGAVVHDIIRVMLRRFPNMQIVIVPAAVQGEAAASEIVEAIRIAGYHSNADVLILARGGGSLEDLAAFNSEEVARAIFVSEIPVISAVGHETDYTIADFVADLRAPTPSAAAELAVPVKHDVNYSLQTLLRRMHGSFARQVSDRRRVAEKLIRRLVHPKRRIDDLRIRIDDNAARLSNAMQRLISLRRERLAWRSQRLFTAPVRNQIHALSDRHAHLMARLRASASALLQKKRSALESAYGRMYALGPAAVMDRGYSITRTLPGRLVLTDSADAEIGQKVEVILSKGSLNCRIERIYKNGKKEL